MTKNIDEHLATAMRDGMPQSPRFFLAGTYDHISSTRVSLASRIITSTSSGFNKASSCARCQFPDRQDVIASPPGGYHIFQGVSHPDYGRADPCYGRRPYHHYAQNSSTGRAMAVWYLCLRLYPERFCRPRCLRVAALYFGLVC